MPTQSEALLEAYASCPPNVKTYFTLELQHPTFDQPARVVTGVGDDRSFGLEDGGGMATFQACPFGATPPEQREGQPPSTRLTIDNVNRELVPKIRAAQAVRAYITVVYREYVSGDLTEPAFGPVSFTLKTIQMVGASLTGTATVSMLLNKRFPRLDKNYTVQQFPSLAP